MKIKTIVYYWILITMQLLVLQPCYGASFFEMTLKRDSIYTPGKMNLTMKLTDKAKIEREKAALDKWNARVTEEWNRERIAAAKNSKIEAWVVAQEFIKDYLKSPGTADWGSLWGGDHQNPETCVTNMGFDTYQVRGWVDSQNSFGATVRTDFLLMVKYKGNENWGLLKTPIMAQR